MKSNLVIIYGKNVIQEAIKSKRYIKTLYLQDTLKDKTFEELIKSAHIGSITYLKTFDMNRRFGEKHGGVVAEIAEYTYKMFNDVINATQSQQNITFILLDGLEDPHNLGAILRTADATKMDAVIIPKNRSVRLNATVAKVSTGAIEYVDVVEVVNLVNTIKELKKLGFWIIGLESDGNINYDEQDYRGKIALVIGSEGKGISRLVKENCDLLVKIPMLGHVNSLNASVSASLLFYEVIRSRKR